jgi:ELWxxDGT repeat protein
MARLLTAALVAASLLLVAAVTPAEASAATSAVLVKDIAPGPARSDPEGLIGVAGTLFFAADDGVHGDELWKSDGTTAGTTMVKDINPGAGSSIGNGACTYFIEGRTPFAAIKGTLFFAADDGVHGCELWTSDGTAGGTSMVADINPGSADSYPQHLVEFNGTLFFSANDGVHGRELWKSDGTLSGTRLVKDVIPGADADSNGFETALGVGHTLFFIAEDYARDSEQLWRTDGTAAGTSFIAHTYCAYCDRATEFQGSLNGAAILTVRAGCCGSRQLFRSDGTPEGTYMFDWRSSFVGSAIMNGAIYYFDRAFELGEGTTELWKSDGTIQGTTRVADILPDRGAGVSGPTVLGGRVLFFVNAYVPGATMLSLWATGGTAESTSPLFDVGPLDTNQFGYAYGVPYSTTVVGNSLFFAAAVGGSGYELWTTDGTAAGTYLVRDIYPGVGDSFYLPHYGPDETLSAVDGTLFFNADDGLHGHELWKTTPPLRSALKNASRYCTALRESLGDAEFSQRYKNRGKCVGANY